jgi:ribonucleoside-diphosphate reductase alpha chain
VSFMRIFDVATETIKQGGKRRGANMAILRVDHPDILEFIECKKDMQSITNFNISVGITDEFMGALRRGDSFSFRDPRVGGGKKRRGGGGSSAAGASGKIQAAEIFRRIVRSAWECGDPGLVFLDRINFFNPTPQVGEIESTNPCSEQPLLPYESCNLGSLNLLAYFNQGKFDWRLFREDIVRAVRFLDNVIEVNHYPVAECKKITRRNRKIGLGIMGFADLLLVQGIPYGSEEALRMGQAVMSFMDRVAKLSSVELAKTRGAFPNWKGSIWQRLGYPKMRNATVSTVAPTGTISMIAGVSSGIEPIYSGVIARNVLSGQRLVEVHPTVEMLLGLQGVGSEQLREMSESQIADALGPAWSPSHTLSVEAHIKMQAGFQWHSDSAVSKTINLPADATEEEVAQAYAMAYNLGCKGITVYRDRSRPSQVLETPGEETADHCPAC